MKSVIGTIKVVGKVLLLGGVVSVAALAYLLAMTLFGVKPDVHAAMTVAGWAFVAGSVLLAARALMSGYRSMSTTKNPAKEALAAGEPGSSSAARGRGLIRPNDDAFYGLALMTSPREYMKNSNFED